MRRKFYDTVFENSVSEDDVHWSSVSMSVGEAKEDDWEDFTITAQSINYVLNHNLDIALTESSSGALDDRGLNPPGIIADCHVYSRSESRSRS